MLLGMREITKGVNDASVHLVDGRVAVDALQQALVCVVLYHGWELLVEDIQPSSSGLELIVDSAAHLTTFDEPLQQYIIWNFQEHGGTNLRAVLLQPPVQGLGLRERARETIEDGATSRIWLLETSEDDLRYFCIWQQLTRAHSAFTVAVAILTQQVAARDVRDAQRLAQQASLGPLAGAGTTKQQYWI